MGTVLEGQDLNTDRKTQGLENKSIKIAFGVDRIVRVVGTYKPECVDVDVDVVMWILSIETFFFFYSQNE